MLALASSEFSRCRGMCLNFWHKWELTPSCLIYSGTSEMQLAPCSPILCWFWAFLGQGRLPAAMHSAAAFYWISGIKRNRNRWFLLKKIISSSLWSWFSHMCQWGLLNGCLFLLGILCPKTSSLASTVQHRHSPEYRLLAYTSEKRLNLSALFILWIEWITFIWHLYESLCQEWAFCFLKISEIG